MKEISEPQNRPEVDYTPILPGVVENYPLIHSTLYVEYNYNDFEFENADERGEFLLNFFSQPTKMHDLEIPLYEYIKKNYMKVAIAVYPDDIDNEKMEEVLTLLDSNNILSELWIGLRDEDGCYTNPTSLDATKDMVDNTLMWMRVLDLKTNTIGLDLEPNVQINSELIKREGGSKFVEYMKYLYMVMKTSPSKIDDFNRYLRELRSQGVRVKEYRCFKNAISSNKIEDFEKPIFLQYSSLVPEFLAKILIKTFFNPKKEVLATGIVSKGSDDPTHTPGRQFGDQEVPHITREALVRDIYEGYKKMLRDIGSETDIVLPVYFFALDHSDAAILIRSAINEAQNKVYLESLENSH